MCKRKSITVNIRGRGIREGVREERRVKYLSTAPVNESKIQRMTAEELATYLDELVSKGHDIQVLED